MNSCKKNHKLMHNIDKKYQTSVKDTQMCEKCHTKSQTYEKKLQICVTRHKNNS